MNNERAVMPTQDPNIRNKNFNEVALGLTREQAEAEASRCLNCKNPLCVKGCPVGVNIPRFIEKVKNGEIDEALKIINEQNSLPGVCGRVCPQEKQCEKNCVRGLRGDAVFIGALERYVADNGKLVNDIEIIENNKKIAIIGSGPAGLTCAGDLRKLGYDVTIFESLHKAGGVLTYGIPEFRLPKSIVDKEIENLEHIGVKIIKNVLVGKSIKIEELQEEYDAVFISTGAGLPKFMNIKGIEYSGVYSANEILTRINLMGAYKDDAKTPIKKARTAIVVGGGNVAMDAARSLKRLGIDVTIMYQRSETEMPARIDEINHAKEEGINFKILSKPIEILSNDELSVTGVKYIENKLLDTLDDSGRRMIEEIPGSESIIDTEMVVMAIGTEINNIAFKNLDLNIKNHGIIETDGTKTSENGIFAGGDVATGAATVISACGMGKTAAKEIHDYLGGKA